mmetsp:Transcript_31271/g.38069  ORF Transcript_31271/g.38069 Transcript_31271/m.38069 type:complete len:80 (-) Transcript_31271:28-267(-)
MVVAIREGGVVSGSCGRLVVWSRCMDLSCCFVRFGVVHADIYFMSKMFQTNEGCSTWSNHAFLRSNGSNFKRESPCPCP